VSVRIPPGTIEARARIVAAPENAPRRAARAFDLHPGVHGLVIGAYASFGTILCTAFMAPEMAIPAAIVAISIVALFLVPGLWARVVPDDGRPRQSWAEFMSEGVDTNTGRLTAGEAMAQILTLPALVLLLAIVMAVIQASV
jgi:hypothetical protein